MFTALRRRLAATTHILALGAVSWVFSEGLFWAHWRDDETAADVVGTWLVYCVITYLALAAARRYAVTTIAGLFLVGALYGWLVEGAIAGTAFLAFPLQVSFTGLSWHAPLTVCLGWCVLPVVLRRGRHRETLLVVAALGLGSGLWTAGVVHGPDVAHPPSTLAVAIYSAAMALALAVAYPICDRLAPAPSGLPARGGVAIAGLATLAWFLLGIAVAIPWAMIVLPVLLALPLVALHRGRAPLGDRAPLLAPPRRPLRPRDAAPLALMPIIATLAYAATEPTVGEAPVVVVYLLTLPAGFAALWWSLRRVGRVGA